MRKLIITLAITSHSPAHAELGRFPVVEAGAVAGLGSTPIPYTTVGGTADTRDDLGGVFGPALRVHLDATKFLVNLEGIYNVASRGANYLMRAQIVLGAGAGFRTRHNLLKSMSRSAPDSQGYVTTTTEHYVDRHVPMLLGLSAAATVIGGETTTLLEAGFTLQSPQIVLTIAPALAVSTGSPGVHWSYGMGFPIGRKSICFKIDGYHLASGDPLDNSGRRLGMLVMFSLGVGSSFGVK